MGRRARAGSVVAARSAVVQRASLDTYVKKRDFGKTPEPRGRKARRKASEPLEFVVQKHGARRLHYDFRLELDGVLKSWAVPKGPSLVPGERRLAVATEDHPLAYASFEGVIPKGEYGAGAVVVWDRGYWTCDGDPHEGLVRGRLDFSLEGEKMRGGWRLVRMASREKAENWLLMKRRDAAAREGEPDALVVSQPASVLTGRDLDEVRADEDRTWSGSDDASVMPVHALGDPSAIEGAVRRGLPRRLEPQLATLVDAPPDAPGWLHEMKLDGYRLLCAVDRGKVRLVTRRGNDWTERFAAIAKDAEELAPHRVVLDGEAVVLDAEGRPDFQALQNAMGTGQEDLFLYAFDLLWLDGWDLRGASLRARKEALRLLLAATPALSRIRYGDHVEGPGAAVLEQACAMGLEGIVCKRADAPYRAGRGRDWLKVKCRRRDEVVVIGYTAPEGSRVGLGALLVATREEGGALRYAGKVGTGFDDATLRSLTRRLDAIARPEPAITVKLAPRERRRVTWVEPQLVAEIAFHGFTSDGILRHPAFQGLREDKGPEDVRIEHAVSIPARDRKTRATPPVIERSRGESIVAGVRITHPDRVLFPEQGLTKQDLAAYYATIADVVLPGLYDRPLTLLRCPDGRHRECFHQKAANQSVPRSMSRVRVAPGKDYVTVRNLEDLLGLVQIGVLEIHVWGSRADKLERPDILVFDLDPDTEVPWAHVVATAETLRDRLGRLDLAAFPRVTGGKGLHVVVPIERRTTWEDAKQFTQDVALELQRAAPDHFTTNISKARRKGKILIDYLRNARESTAIASYSVRAREGAPVAVPLSWEELSGTEAAPRFTPDDVIARVRAGVDPWRGFDDARARLTKKAMAAVKGR
jgi:bifunctional non-homologous end joining protein LigD